jgi:hypothetical protein
MGVPCAPADVAMVDTAAQSTTDNPKRMAFLLKWACSAENVS